MKKVYSKFTFIILIINVLSVFSQDKESDNESSTYDKFSVDFNFGQSKAIRPFSQGYFTSKPNRYLFIGELNSYSLGIRYMFNNKFGLKLMYARDEIKSQNESGSFAFETEQDRLSINGVFNFTRIFDFEAISKRVGLLGHFGIQVSKLYPKSGSNINSSEDNGGFIVGLSPQFKLSQWSSIFFDFSVINNVRQHLNWDGNYAAYDTNLSGIMYSITCGVNFYFGKNKEHADWIIIEKQRPIDSLSKETIHRVNALEEMLNDVDKDGVPDYLDRENNTPNGVIVDSRGRFIDVNRNGIPDELEKKSVDGNDGLFSNLMTKEDAIKVLIEKGYVNVFYDINQDVPNSGSTNNVYYIIKFLKAYPDAVATLVGYADKRGNKEANLDLSYRRALRLYNLIISNGVHKNRLKIDGQGVDIEFSSENSINLDLSRRVSIILE